MQTIFVITTGGTIEKEYSVQTCTVGNNIRKIGSYLRKLQLPDIELRLIPLMNKDSLQMTPEDRSLLVSEIAQLLPLNAPIVITHGTDTMVESGTLIEDSLPDLRVPIVLTGAMKPLGFDSSDGLQNLTESLCASRLLDPGVYVVFHSQVIPVAKARKDKQRGTFVRIESQSGLAEVTGAIADCE